MGVLEKGIGDVSIEEVGMEDVTGGNRVAKNCTIEGPGVELTDGVSPISVRAKVMLVATTSAGLIVGVDTKLLQAVNSIPTSEEKVAALPTIFTFPLP